MRRVVFAVLVVAATACGGSSGTDPSILGPAPAAGYRLEPAVTGLDRPTQMIVGPDGRLWIAQLAGAEDAGTGQVVAVDPASGDREVLLDGLDKPVGIAVLEGFLWLALERSIARAPLVDGGIGEIETVLADLPYNGRSIGSLTVTPQGRLWFDTSGALDGGARVAGSGTLWELDPADPTTPRAVVTGLKHAYAHAFDAQGRAWTTEIQDGTYDGSPAPDAVFEVEAGTDYGWPACIGIGEPVQQYGGTEQGCAAVPAPVTLFDPGATPTGIAVAPWDPATLLVTVWTRDTVVSVPAAPRAGPARLSVVAQRVAAPQDLLVLDDGTVLVSAHDAGAIYRLSR